MSKKQPKPDPKKDSAIKVKDVSQDGSSLYKKRSKLYSKIIKGHSHKQRIVLTTLIYGAFFLIPWLSIGDRPAVYFDLTGRQFHIFWLNFWPQDFVYLGWFLIIAAFSLFLFTAIAGRLWCGYACPQTIWTLAFIWVEEKIEGSPSQRRKLDKEPYSHKKLAIKFAKHITWLIMAFLTGATFIAYFYGAPALFTDLFQAQLPNAAAVGILVFTYLTYIDAAWLREHVCVYMCPYAKFQSVMYDKQTLIVSYDEQAGEPRGSLKSTDRGRCIDCKECVHVCPTGIDIRDGVQIECINCALCLDVCNDVMKATKQEPNLILFTNLDAQDKKKAQGTALPHHYDILKKAIFRPRTLFYIFVLSVFSSMLLFQLVTRSALEASVVPIREPLFTQISSSVIANDYNIKIANKSGNTLEVSMSIDSSDYTLQSQMLLSIAAGDTYESNLRVSYDSSQSKPLSGPIPIDFIITNETQNNSQSIKSRFVFPATLK